MSDERKGEEERADETWREWRAGRTREETEAKIARMLATGSRRASRLPNRA